MHGGGSSGLLLDKYAPACKVLHIVAQNLGVVPKVCWSNCVR